MRKVELAGSLFASDHNQEEVLKTVIVYDDAAAGKRAMRLFCRVHHVPGEERNFQPQPWRFEFLADPDWAALATHDALNAGLIIVAASRSDLPKAVQNWLTECLSQKRDSHAAVVALLGSEEQPSSANSTMLHFLRNAAVDAGLDFFSPSPAPEPSFSIFRDDLYEHTREIIHLGNPNRCWGINE